MSEHEKNKTDIATPAQPELSIAPDHPISRSAVDDPSTYPALGRWMMFVDNPKNVDKIVYSLYVLCAGLFLADFFYHKHTYIAIENIPGFYAIYGFFMCAALVICAKVMRLFLKRDETYYAPYDVESEHYPEADLEKDSHNG